VAAEPFPVVHPDQVEDSHGAGKWLVDQLWSEQAVGFLAGLPKSNKTWLALDLAVSVASGTPALGRFNVPAPGPALVYAAEDSLSSVRDRLRSIAAAHGVTLSRCDLGLIAVPSLRLDLPADRDRIRATLQAHKPRLLVLDPLVRMHRLDENAAGDVAPLLGELRDMQRSYQLAVMLVHHLRKNGQTASQPGTALRGSGDLHAWADSSLYIRQTGKRLSLVVEHRSAAHPSPLILEPVQEPTFHLRCTEEHTDQPDPTLEHSIIEVLAAANAPVTRDMLRERLHVRNQAIGLALVRLRSQGNVERCSGGFRLRTKPPEIPIPIPAQAREWNGPPQPSTA